MAVWLVDARGLSRLAGRSGGRSLRPARATDTAPAPTSVPAPERRFEPLSVPWPDPTPAAVEPASVGPVAYEAVEVPAGPSPARPEGAPRVPAAYTAVEGSYRDVARVPLWRKALSLVILLVILVVAGLAIAAIAGATFGVVAELLDSAIG